MAAPVHPFTGFNFSIEITRDDGAEPLVGAAFAECDGLEMSQEVKTIRDGGSNDRQIRLGGPLSYGEVTLKRGMSADFALWTWLTDSIADPRLRADAEVVMLAEDGSTERVRFVLERCLPVKVKAPALNAREGQVAIEELQLAFERMTVKQPGNNGGETP